jgi:LPXTG-motif cell wall-anchored protein
MKRWLGLLCVVAIILTLGTTAFAADTAQVRAINGVVGGKGYDVLVADKAAFTNVALGKATAYSPLAAGAIVVKIVATGTTTPVLATANLTIAAGKNYAIVLVGEDPKVQAVLASDDKSVPVSGKSVVRFVDNVGDVPTADFAPVGGTPIVKALAAYAVSDYVAIAAGKIELWGYIAGTTQGAPIGSAVTLDAGKVYTLVASGFPVMGGATVDLYVVVDPGLATGAALPTTGGESPMLAYLLLSAGGLLAAGGAILRRR